MIFVCYKTPKFWPFVYNVGREARTHGLGLDLAKVELDSHSGKIVVDSSDTTTASNIFAIGDAINVSQILGKHMKTERIIKD